MFNFIFSRLHKPLDKHIEQASLYADVLKIKRIVFLYIQKDTCEMKEFIVDRDDKVVSRINKRIYSIVDHVDKGVAPERPCSNKFDEMALNCIFCNHCFSK